MPKNFYNYIAIVFLGIWLLSLIPGSDKSPVDRAEIPSSAEEPARQLQADNKQQPANLKESVTNESQDPKENLKTKTKACKADTWRCLIKNQPKKIKESNEAFGRAFKKINKKE